MKYSNSFKLFLFLTISNINAIPIESGVCSPYFASIKARKANLHVGPGKEYKVIVSYIFKTFPVMITAKYDHWRKIIDVDGTKGWIHKSMLAKDRYVIVKDQVVPLYQKADLNSFLLGKVKKNVISKLISINNSWCNVKIDYNGMTFKGWMLKNALFGVH